MNTFNSDVKICKKKTAKMEVWGQKINQKMEEMQSEVARAQVNNKDEGEAF